MSNKLPMKSTHVTGFNVSDVVYYIIMGWFSWSTSLQWYKLILRIKDMVKDIYPLNGASLLSCYIKIVFFLTLSQDYYHLDKVKKVWLMKTGALVYDIV